jgi:hypothetical protein
MSKILYSYVIVDYCRSWENNNNISCKLWYEYFHYSYDNIIVGYCRIIIEYKKKLKKKWIEFLKIYFYFVNVD